MLVTRDRCRFDWKEKWFAAATHVVNSTEPPGADPHARWCGRGAVARPPIPIFGKGKNVMLHLDLCGLTLLAGHRRPLQCDSAPLIFEKYCEYGILPCFR